MDEKLLPDGRSAEQLPTGQDKQQPTVTMTAIDVLVMVSVPIVVGLLFCVIAVGLIGMEASRRPEFSVVMDGHSRLEDRVPRAFNLTMRIDNSFGGKSEVCVGGEATVSYGGVPLAGCRVQDLCVPPKCSAELPIVAVSGGVGLPRELAEIMADEERSASGGVVRVEVRVVSPEHRSFVSCMAALAPGGVASPCQHVFLSEESDGVRPTDGDDSPGFLS
jgi:hypothetical protein